MVSSSLLLLLLGSFMAVAFAKPIWPVKTGVPWTSERYLDAKLGQQLLADPFSDIPSSGDVLSPERTSFHFEPQANSVGLQLMTNEEVLHFWLPLGRRVFTRDAPALPLHPLSARVATLIHTTPQLAAPEQLEEIQCHVWTHDSFARGRQEGIPETSKISFAIGDGLVQFASEPQGRFWLDRREVESYECS